MVKEDIIKNIHVETDKIAVIYNGCSLYQGNVEAPAVKPEKKFLFSVGTVLPKKNFHVLPCLLVDNDYELIIAGMKSDYEKRIMEEAIRFGVSDRVKIIGSIADCARTHASIKTEEKQQHRVEVFVIFWLSSTKI